MARCKFYMMMMMMMIQYSRRNF